MAKQIKALLEKEVLLKRQRAIKKILELRKKMKVKFTDKEIQEMINFGRKY